VRGELVGVTTCDNDAKVTLRRLKAVQFTFVLGRHAADTHSEAQSILPTLQTLDTVTFTPPSRHCSAVKLILEDKPTMSVLVPFNTLVDTDMRRTVDTASALQTLNLYNRATEGQPMIGMASHVVVGLDGSTQLTAAYNIR
jgi:hypothetical protein